MSEKHKHMEELRVKGIAAAPGLTISKVFLYEKEQEKITADEITDLDEAKENLDFALQRSKKELRKVLSLAIDKLGDKRAAIFEAQIMILDDPVLIENIYKRVKEEKKTPEFIVDDEISKYQNLMTQSNEPYMKERSHDIEDIKNRIIRNLKRKKWKSKIEDEAVVVTENLTPADTLLFSKSKVSGYVTDFGGLTSHAAILARSLNIPAVLGTHDITKSIENKDKIIVDGYHGLVIINPQKETLDYYSEKLEEIHRFDEELAKLKDLKSITEDGVEISIMGNLDMREEIDQMIRNGAKGIGLVRTEQIIEEFEEFPDEDEQFEIYDELSEKLYPQKIIIRTLDIGGDKVLPVNVKEPNPFLGWRGVRFLNDNIDLFKSQLRAILRASYHKNLRIMIPMVTSIFEIKKVKTILEECKQELRDKKINFDEHIKLGIMIEVPSAAVMAKEFSMEVDFISIGTNDLIQYLLAVDRGNEIVSDLYQEFHPAVIRTINHIIQSAKDGKEFFVSMCGEMAADPIAIPLLVGMGLDSLSVSGAAIPTIKKIIRSMKFCEAKELADECMKMSTEIEIKDRVKRFYKEKLQDCTVEFE